jgi:hypothetical protein
MMKMVHLDPAPYSVVVVTTPFSVAQPGASWGRTILLYVSSAASSRSPQLAFPLWVVPPSYGATPRSPFSF